MIDSINKTNISNMLHYHELMDEHIKDGGKYPVPYALTGLIEDAIKTKTYKIYSGGGYEHNTTKSIDNYDVVVFFTYGGDPNFMVCVDNSEGDCCELNRSNKECRIIKKLI
jgi:hypothetical protein